MKTSPLEYGMTPAVTTARYWPGSKNPGTTTEAEPWSLTVMSNDGPRLSKVSCTVPLNVPSGKLTTDTRMAHVPTPFVPAEAKLTVGASTGGGGGGGGMVQLMDTSLLNSAAPGPTVIAARYMPGATDPGSAEPAPMSSVSREKEKRTFPPTVWTLPASVVLRPNTVTATRTSHFPSVVPPVACKVTTGLSTTISTGAVMPPPSMSAVHSS